MAFLEGGCLFSGQSRDWGVWATCLKICEKSSIALTSLQYLPAVYVHLAMLAIWLFPHWFSHASVPMVIYPYIPGIYGFRNPESYILVAVQIITWNVGPSDCQHISFNYNQKSIDNGIQIYF